jgi:hypothetical protein
MWSRDTILCVKPFRFTTVFEERSLNPADICMFISRFVVSICHLFWLGIGAETPLTRQRGWLLVDTLPLLITVVACALMAPHVIFIPSPHPD